MKAADITLSKRYARAYMDLDGAVFDKKGDEAARALIAELEFALVSLEGFRRLLSHPLVDHDDKHEIVSKVLPKELMVSRAAGLTRLMLKENRFYLLEGVLKECRGIYDAYAGFIQAETVSRHPLPADEVQRIAAALSAAAGRKARVKQTISESVIGGMELRLGDLLADATVRGRLDKLRKKVLTR